MNVAIILAGGSGLRMNIPGKPKQFIKLSGKPIIAYTLEKFEYHDDIDEIVLVCIKEWKSDMQKIISRYNFKKVTAIIDGGATRQLSIYNALNYLRDKLNHDDYVIIHDGVRPLITDKIISNNFDCAKKTGNAVTVVKSNESILMSCDGKSASKVPDRNILYIEQGPQTLHFDEILDLFDRADRDGITDMTAVCTVMERYGVEMHFVEGDYRNIKITTPTDYYIFKAFIDMKEAGEAFGGIDV